MTVYGQAICGKIVLCCWTYLCDYLHLLALAVLRLRDGGLEPLDKLVIEFLGEDKSVSEQLRLGPPRLEALISTLPQHS